LNYDFSMREAGFDYEGFRSHPAHYEHNPDDYDDDYWDLIRHARQISVDHFAPPDGRTNSEETVLTNLNVYGTFKPRRENYNPILRAVSCPQLQHGRTDMAVPVPNYLLGTENLRLRHPGSLMLNPDEVASSTARIREGFPRSVSDALQRFSVAVPEICKCRIFQTQNFRPFQTYYAT
jgi:hypothetical protein